MSPVAVCIQSKFCFKMHSGFFFIYHTLHFLYVLSFFSGMQLLRLEQYVLKKLEFG